MEVKDLTPPRPLSSVWKLREGYAVRLFELGATNALARSRSGFAPLPHGFRSVSTSAPYARGYRARSEADFWIMTLSLLLDAAAINWCKVLGSRGEDTHQTQVIPKDRHEEVRMSLLCALGINAENWEAYQNSIVEFRDQIVAHHDLNATAAKYPNYDLAIAAVNHIFSTIRIFADPDSLGGVPSSLDRWSNIVSDNKAAIVKAAFRSSAELGPNIPERPLS